jgi:hypothetical protein
MKIAVKNPSSGATGFALGITASMQAVDSFGH